MFLNKWIIFLFSTKKEAREEGRRQGKQEGIRESRIEIAKGLIGILDIYTVAEITELPIEVVKELAENN